MSRLKKLASDFIKLPDMFSVSNNGLEVKDHIKDFLKSNLLNTKRNVAIDETNGVIVAHFVMDRAALENEFNTSVDDATCKFVIKTLDENFSKEIKEKLSNTGLEFASVQQIEFEYGDGVFHTLIILLK